MRSGRKTIGFWLVFPAALLLLSVGAVMLLSRLSGGTIATVTQDGRVLYSIDLSNVTEPYTITVAGYVENIISVENGRICIESATCPDQICVRHGWVSGGISPIVCLPNGLVITVTGTDSLVDAISY